MKNANNTNLSIKSISEETTIQIYEAVTPKEKETIYHFRYQIYIEEMSKTIKEVDYYNQQLHDDLDDWAILLYAKIGSEIVGTARINIGSFGDFSKELTKSLNLHIFQNCITDYSYNIAFLTKLMVAANHRSSPVLYLLIGKCYEICCTNRVEFGFGICNFHLPRLYEHMGFHRYTKNFTLPGYGLQIPLVMLANDIQHFRTVRSPLFRLARKREIVNTQAVDWFHENIIKHSTIINSQLITQDEFWSILSAHLSGSPAGTIAILKGLSEEEAKTFLHSCSSYIHCETGELITPQGDVSYSHNLLLSGKLKSLTFQRPAKEYARPGQHFGANGLTEHNKHTEDIIVTSPAEILVLSGMAFQRFFHSYPEIAHKIVYNTTRLARERLHSLRSKSSHL
ncbi:cyclic nucleotide-binding domain-containing protein [Propionispora vibrioides]|uniref:Acetyltransferase (GNAT) domain-containing protein n=1 Tax=Propionispora vibrioides TaxID=112903 RepID=A0A1H8XV62_9FIRM|nr:cyclic nucleotide-binding domain-containing protein [Propionispora vibrioides]SEP43930.1 Acetyltransferase (GNAT) domain-containing protein [Propionispora vibrioides]